MSPDRCQPSRGSIDAAELRGISTATSTCKTRSRRLRRRAEVQVTMCEEGTAVGDGRSTTSTFGESNHARDNRWFASATVYDDDRF